jgi:hypothetical protein
MYTGCKHTPHGKTKMTDQTLKKQERPLRGMLIKIPITQIMATDSMPQKLFFQPMRQY